MMQDQALQDSALKERLVCKYLSCPMFMGVVAAILLILCVVLQPAEVSTDSIRHTRGYQTHTQQSVGSLKPYVHACACACACACADRMSTGLDVKVTLMVPPLRQPLRPC